VNSSSESVMVAAIIAVMLLCLNLELRCFSRTRKCGGAFEKILAGAEEKKKAETWRGPSSEAHSCSQIAAVITTFGPWHMIGLLDIKSSISSS
jgi:hypothetical protein